MNSSTIKAAVACWLRYDRQCPIVTLDRGVYQREGIPDVLAVATDRRIVEVEVKVSLSDFRVDASKRKWAWEEATGKGPKLFYYAVPNELVAKVRPLLQDGHGLLTVGDHFYLGNRTVTVVVNAKRNGKAPRMTMRQMVDLVKNQSGTLCALLKRLDA